MCCVQVPRQRRISWCCAASYFAIDNLLKCYCSYWFDNLGFILRENLLLDYNIPSSLGLPTNVCFIKQSITKQAELRKRTALFPSCFAGDAEMMRKAEHFGVMESDGDDGV